LRPKPPTKATAHTAADRAGEPFAALTFPPASKEALICLILFYVRGIALFGRIVVLLVLLD
jgi:hypothetical protein